MISTLISRFQPILSGKYCAVLRFAAEKIGAFPVKTIFGISPGFILLFGGAGFLW
jgi:hypothetical protein